jgi:hypothetical protein
MNAELNLKSILSQVKKLNKTEQVTLLQKISLLIKKENSASTSVNLSDISGLGSSLWKNIDVEKYVDDERQW